MEELYFIGMDILEETKTLVNETIEECTKGMTENELRAYNLGVENTLRALFANTCTEHEGEFVINVNNLETDFYISIDELKDYLTSICDDEDLGEEDDTY